MTEEERETHELRKRLADELYEEQQKIALETETPQGDLWDEDNPVTRRILEDLEKMFGSNQEEEEEGENELEDGEDEDGD